MPVGLDYPPNLPERELETFWNRSFKLEVAMPFTCDDLVGAICGAKLFANDSHLATLPRVRSRLFSFAAALFSRAFQPNTRRTRFYSRVVCACLLVVHLVASLGLVLPHWASKEVKERFPCEDCPCGCPTAQFCWDQCCCHTDEEKIAWANENGIESPIFLLDRVALKTRSTIQKPVVRACCAGKSKTGTVVATCDSSATDSQPNREVHAVAKTDRNYSLVLIDAALRCHGMDLAFLLLSDTWVPSEQVCQALPDPLLIEWQMIANEYALSYRPLPAAPVPIARFC